MSKNKTFFVAILALSLITAGAVSAANLKTAKPANKPTTNQVAKPIAQPTGTFAIGQITAIKDTTITLNKKPENRVYTVDASNAQFARGNGPKAVYITIKDIKVGETIKAFGKITGNNIVATSIIAPEASRPSVLGDVKSINGNTFTIERPKMGNDEQPTSFVVNTSNSTIFKQQGKAASIKDITIGKKVVVSGDVNKDTKTITAENINIIVASENNKQTNKNFKEFNFGASVSDGVFKFFGSIGNFAKNLFKK